VIRWGVAEGRDVYVRRRRWDFDGHLAVGWVVVVGWWLVKGWLVKE
jgi:hypothetical protein